MEQRDGAAGPEADVEAEAAAPAASSPSSPQGPGGVAAEPPAAEADTEDDGAQGEAESVSEAEAEVVEEDPEVLQARAAERDEYLALAQRTQADFENFRKRAAKDARAAEARGVGKLARELLPALDNLDRALAAAEAQEGEGDHHLTKGIRLVQSELQGALTRAGIEAFSPAGEPFDPTHHEAMAQQPVEGAASGTVVEVFQQGYLLNGSVLRPARVVVAA